MRKILFLTALLVFTVAGYGQTLNVSSGSVKRIEGFASKYVDARNVDVWLPDGYSGKKKYAVVYMHDGQMLFDGSTTWNKQEWQVDETVGRLIKEKKIKNCIVVGVWNNGEYRTAEYFPQKALADIPAEIRDPLVARWLKNKPLADNYLKFLVEELKPYIDKNFATKTNPQNTFLAGSSMGGLISVYALCEYPNVFGGAAGISTHLPLISPDEEKNKVGSAAAAFRAYLEKHLPKTNSRKIYFDYGDQTLDAYYPPFQKLVDDLMRAKGFNAKNWITRSFPGENHSEASWAKRLYVPFEFFLGKR